MSSLAEIERAAQALGAGELVVFPTETLYGVGCHALRGDALARLRIVKQREAEKGIAVIIGDVAQLALLSENISPATRRLVERFWPGPLTVLVPARPELPPPLVRDGLVGVRLSSNPTARALAIAIGAPLAAPSANPAGAEPARDISAARAYFGDTVAVYLDAGILVGPPSTLVDPGPPLRILRAGAIPEEALHTALG